jgi:hypothetical protein
MSDNQIQQLNSSRSHKVEFHNMINLMTEFKSTVPKLVNLHQIMQFTLDQLVYATAVSTVKEMLYVVLSRRYS